MTKWINVEQSDEDGSEWMALRIAKIGGSSIGKIMANYGKAFGDPAHDQAERVAVESITGEKAMNDYSNAHMERGKEQEPVAKALYEERTFSIVTNGGFYDFDNLVGVSPDGLSGVDGLLEIKSVIRKTHFKTIKRGAFDPSYKWQLYLNLKVSGRKWIDYVEYCAEFPEGKQLFVQRVFAKDCSAEFAMIENRMLEFKKLVSDKMALIEAI